jgi:broad specificity phosphatase PhoE
MHAGEIEGLAWSEVRRRYPPSGDQENPFSRDIPGCESWADLYARAGERLRRVCLDHEGEHVLVVTHGGVVGASFAAFGDVPIGRAKAFVSEARNTSLTTWRWDGDGATLVRYNDAAHLGG